MTGRIPVHLWTWPAIAKHFGVGKRTVQAWKEAGAPIKSLRKGMYAEAWELVDWLYAQPEADPTDNAKHLTNRKA